MLVNTFTIILSFIHTRTHSNTFTYTFAKSYDVGFICVTHAAHNYKSNRNYVSNSFENFGKVFSPFTFYVTYLNP